MYCSNMIAEEVADAFICVARSGTPRPATARLLCGPQPANLQRAEVPRKYPKLLLCIGFSRHARHQKRLDSGHFLRPLYRVVLNLKDPVLHLKYMRNAFYFYVSSLRGAVEKNLFVDTDENPQSLASALMAYFMGVMDLWIHGDLNDDMFRAQILHGYIHLLRPIAHDDSLKILTQKNAQIRKVLSKRKMKPSYIYS